MAPQNLDQRGEIDRAVAWHRERAVDDRFEEAPAAVPRELDDIGPHVLAMDVTHARDMLLEDRDSIATGKGHVTGVEQQADFFASVIHEPIDIRRVSTYAPM